MNNGRFKSEIDVKDINPFWLLNVIKIIRNKSYYDIGIIVGGYGRSYLCDVISGKKIPNENLKQKIADYFAIPKEFIWKE